MKVSHFHWKSEQCCVLTEIHVFRNFPRIRVTPRQPYENLSGNHTSRAPESPRSPMSARNAHFHEHHQFLVEIHHFMEIHHSGPRSASFWWKWRFPAPGGGPARRDPEPDGRTDARTREKPQPRRRPGLGARGELPGGGARGEATSADPLPRGARTPTRLRGVENVALFGGRLCPPPPSLQHYHKIL